MRFGDGDRSAQAREPLRADVREGAGLDVPKAARAKRKTDYGGVVVEAVTNPAKGTWCTTADTTQYGAGDGAITTECFQSGVGLASGVLDYHGGTPRIVEYKLAAK